jgi:hypothetical protein
MLNKNTINSQTILLTEQEVDTLYFQLGDKLQDIALELMTSDVQVNETDKTNDFASLVIESVDESSRKSAQELKESYESGVHPLSYNQKQTGKHFYEKIGTRLKGAICEELFSDDGPSDNARELLIILIPTIIVILGIPSPYSAIAAPIAALFAKVGLRTLCADHPVRAKTKERLKAQLELHEQNLSYLEQVRIRYVEVEPPPELLRMVEWEKRQVRKMREDVKNAI